MNSVAFLTVGEAPRTDVLPEILAHLPEGMKVVEAGALDGLSHDEALLHSPMSTERVLVTRMSDGTSICVDKAFAWYRLQQIIDDLQDRVELMCLLCSAPFDRFTSTVPVVYPSELLRGLLSSVRFPGRIAVIVPSEKQIAAFSARYRGWGIEPVVVDFSPYEASVERFGDLVRDIARFDVSALVLDCFGYSIEIARTARLVTRLPVFCIRELLADIVSCLIRAGFSDLTS